MEKINKLVRLLESGQLVLMFGLNSYLPKDLNSFLNEDPKRIDAILGAEGSLDDLIDLLNSDGDFDVEIAADLWENLILFEVLTSEDYVSLLEKNLELGREQANNPMMDNFSKNMFVSLLKNAEDELSKAKLYNSSEVSEKVLNFRANVELILNEIYSDEYVDEFYQEVEPEDTSIN